MSLGQFFHVSFIAKMIKVRSQCSLLLLTNLLSVLLVTCCRIIEKCHAALY